MDEQITLLYEDDEIRLTDLSHSGTFCRYRKNGKWFRINLTDEHISEEDAKDIALGIKLVFEKLWDIAYSEGYSNGYFQGENDIQTKIKELLGLKEV